MKKTLSKTKRALYYYVGPKHVPGAHPRLIGYGNLWGDCGGVSGDALGISGDVTNLWGDITGLYGDVSGLYGNCANVYGDCTDINGNLNACDITEKTNIKELIDKNL